jgi:hypothetical protein
MRAQEITNVNDKSSFHFSSWFNISNINYIKIKNGIVENQTNSYGSQAFLRIHRSKAC